MTPWQPCCAGQATEPSHEPRPTSLGPTARRPRSTTATTTKARTRSSARSPAGCPAPRTPAGTIGPARPGHHPGRSPPTARPVITDHRPPPRKPDGVQIANLLGDSHRSLVPDASADQQIKPACRPVVRSTGPPLLGPVEADETSNHGDRTHATGRHTVWFHRVAVLDTRHEASIEHLCAVFVSDCVRRR